jgi:DNA-binding Lrp family transcriptional regulator
VTRREPDSTEGTQGRAATAHAFVRRRPGVGLARCFARLFVADGVCCCDAVAGDWDIVLLLQAPDRAGIERLAREHLETAEVEAYELHHAERPWLSQDLEAFIRSYERTRELEKGPEPRGERGGRALVSAYVVVDIDLASHLAPVYSRLYLDDAVVACDLTEGCRSAILLVQARTPEDLEQALSRVRAAPGVLGLRTLPVIGTLDVTADASESRTGAAP